MDKKILIISEKQTNLLEALIYWLNQEKIEHDIFEKMSETIPEDISNIIYINYDNEAPLIKELNKPLIIISSTKTIIELSENIINYIITQLANDDTDYTSAQKEYLYREGIYNLVTTKVEELINDENDINGIVIDTKNCKTKLKDWVFSFDSIAESYAWLSNKNKSNKNFTEKVVNFYHEKVYNDSSKEINYLINKIKNIQDGIKMIDIFVCTKEELETFKTNYFFKLLLKNIRSNYQMYIIDRTSFIENDIDIYNKFLDGAIIYEDCVYIDTYDDEYSLGKVDCKDETIKEYNDYFNYIVKKYGTQIFEEGDINGI